jgi:hypothetical protein
MFTTGLRPGLAIQAIGDDPDLRPSLKLSLRLKTSHATTALAVSPLGDRLACASNLIEVIRPSDGMRQHCRPWRAPWGICRSLSFSPDGEWLVFTEMGRPSAWHLGTDAVVPLPSPWDTEATGWSHVFLGPTTLASVLMCHGTTTGQGPFGRVVYHRLLAGQWEYAGAQSVPLMCRGWLSPDGATLAWAGETSDPGSLYLRCMRDNVSLGTVRSALVRSATAARFLPGGHLAIADSGEALDIIPWRERMGLPPGIEGQAQDRLA